MTDRGKVLEGLEHCISDEHPCEDCPYKKKCIREGWIVALQKDVLELLKEQPEQKHGHWVLDPDGMDWNIPAWRCSICGCRNDNIPSNLERTNPRRWSGSRFCPNCGAIMDEEVK